MVRVTLSVWLFLLPFVMSLSSLKYCVDLFHLCVSWLKSHTRVIFSKSSAFLSLSFSFSVCVSLFSLVQKSMPQASTIKMRMKKSPCRFQVPYRKVWRGFACQRVVQKTCKKREQIAVLFLWMPPQALARWRLNLWGNWTTKWKDSIEVNIQRLLERPGMQPSHSLRWADGVRRMEKHSRQIYCYTLNSDAIEEISLIQRGEENCFYFFIVLPNTYWVYLIFCFQDESKMQ